MPILTIILGIGAGLTALGIFGTAIYCCFFQNAPEEDDRGVYRCLDGDPNFAPGVQQIADWANSPGGLTINNQVLGVLNHGNVLAFSNRFHTTLAQNNLWTWSPVDRGNYYDLLDGVLDRGECNLPAHALRGLLRFAMPYGFNQAENNFAVNEYTGTYHQGFIATHTNQVMGLSANTWRPNGTAAGFYNWENHKTLVYNNQYYDPSYGTSQGGLGYYANEADMAVAQIRGSVNFNQDQFVGIYVLGVLKTDDAAPLAHKGFYVACARSTIDGHLAVDADEYNGNQAGFTVAYIGPYSPGVNGTANNNFNFDNTVDYLNGVVLQ
ncbi:hypothetical protein [Kordiimonas marina]|uniref:hypothetical protein n=1 Tax=Kordiimonas marina TaxID=2872312 RepID=UPI001FF1A195|nr:hypothetical protein [Kordiimonas marina]MCJ9429038.1 hypothetical protein [Kordiimonas marina]